MDLLNRAYAVGKKNMKESINDKFEKRLM
ncbi:hypothetical protein [Leptospira wolffii]